MPKSEAEVVEPPSTVSGFYVLIIIQLFSPFNVTNFLLIFCYHRDQQDQERQNIQYLENGIIVLNPSMSLQSVILL